MNNKIKTYLNSKGIDFSVPFSVEKQNLETVDEKSIYSMNSFESKYIKYTILRKKKELFLRNCLIEATSLSSLDVKEKIVFHNCIFNNVKISKCNLKNAVFYNCCFENSMVINSVIIGSYFVNCRGLEQTDFLDNKMDDVMVVGSSIDLDSLNEKQNKTENARIIEEQFEIGQPGKVVDQKTGEQGEIQMEVLVKKVIRNEVYNEVMLTTDFLANHLFYQCHFVNCNTDDGTSLSSSSDFKECNFLNSKLHFIDVDKTSFDDCTFQNVSFKGNFIHVSFAGPKFSNLSFIEGSTFVACQLDNTNAAEYFEDENIKLNNIELVKRNNEKDSNAVFDKLQELYEILKKEDSQLQDELNQKKKVEEDDVLDYMSSLDDLEYVKLIAKTSKKVVEDKEML